MDHHKAWDFAKEVLKVEGHPLARWAQRLVLINGCYTDPGSTPAEIAKAQEMLDELGEDLQLIEGMASAWVFQGDKKRGLRGVSKVVQAGMSGNPIEYSMALRTNMNALRKFYPKDLWKLYKIGSRLIQFVTPLELEKYYEQAVRVGKEGGIKLWVDKEGEVRYTKLV